MIKKEGDCDEIKKLYSIVLGNKIEIRNTITKNSLSDFSDLSNLDSLEIVNICSTLECESKDFMSASVISKLIIYVKKKILSKSYNIYCITITVKVCV